MNVELPLSWPPAYPLHRAVSAREAAQIDERATSEHGVPSLVLMEHASRGVARLALELAGPDDSFVCVCGPGNNGGDGYGAARFLRSWGRAVEVFCCAPRAPRTGDASLEYALAEAEAPIVAAWEHPEALWAALERKGEERGTVVVDALFGVGLDASRPLDGPFAGWVHAMNESDKVILAVDLPSGMEADTGAPLPECVQAHVTATMAAPKRGLRANPQAAGHVVEVDIGLPGALHGEFLA